jgi:hypothetical protein
MACQKEVICQLKAKLSELWKQSKTDPEAKKEADAPQKTIDAMQVDITR